MAGARADAPTASLLDIISGVWVSQAIHVAAKLGIADLLEAGPQPCALLAEATQTHPEALYRLLRALASVGVFAEEVDGRFRLTPLAEGLRTLAPGSLRGYAIMLGESWTWRAWGEIMHSVQTGESAFGHVFGTELFAYLAGHPEAARVFDAAMTSRSGAENDAIAAAHDFSRGIVVDVGGGQGSLLTTILERNPDARGILCDMPHVIAAAKAHIEQRGLAARCQALATDFFASVPPGGDVYLLKKVIHDWDDERARRILENCRAAMNPGARLLLLEQVILPGNAPAFGKLLDLQMLVTTPNGRERSEAQYRALLESAGFTLAGIAPTKSPLNVIEALPR